LKKIIDKKYKRINRMKKSSKYGRNPKLSSKTHCVMVRFNDMEWNRFLTMYEESNVYAEKMQ